MGEETPVEVQHVQEEPISSVTEDLYHAVEEAVSSKHLVPDSVTTEPTVSPKPVETSKTAHPSATVELKVNVAPAYIHEAIAKIAPEQGFTPGQFQVTLEVGSSIGDGFIAEMFRAQITEGNRNMVVLCKIPPTNEARRKHSMPSFNREVFAYTSFLPAIYEFQREKGITEAQGVGFFNTPHCYLAYYDEAKEESVIAMDDLRLKGYRMWNKMVPVNYEHTKLLMIQLGRLHALSFALKDQRPDLFEKFKVPDPMVETFQKNPPLIDMMCITLDRALTALEPNEEIARQKLLKLKGTMFNDMVNLTDANPIERYAVVGHGDCWSNNMMYSYKKGVPTEVILLDWQICRYVSPTLDILYFLFCCTDGEFRAAHYDEMIHIYYASLRTLLEKLGGDPTRQFPYTTLLRQLKQYGKFGVIMASFLVPMLCMENTDLPDLDAEAEKFEKTQQINNDMFAVNEKSEAKYRKRMSAVIRDAIRYGYL
ncbi:uncharacterized protein LOC131432855 [Malaya genurostris]|uniref:uncharacterized protein LOC131432855 n=1 Tax=Malaya genurostris TaxID=325434 RepID=UPI0026F3C0A3|nr:uncharacterized protein LOC131432855 [Malaya genurostris]